jgi:hypothetical protein
MTARIGVSSPADPGPLRVLGVSRDCGSPAILVAFNRMPSDDELRDLHERLQLLYRKLQPACAWPFPGQVDRAASARRAPTTCGECSYEEAEGDLIEQCPKCKAPDAQAAADSEGGEPT